MKASRCYCEGRVETVMGAAEGVAALLRSFLGFKKGSSQSVRMSGRYSFWYVRHRFMNCWKRRINI